MKLFIIVFSIIISVPCFGLPRVERNSLHNLHSRDIVRIIESDTDLTPESEGAIRIAGNRVVQEEFTEIQNGLFFIYRSITELNITRTGIIISYNLFHNNSVNISDIRLLEIMQISGEYEMTFSENGIEIVSTRNILMRNEQGFREDWITQEIKLTFEFDHMNRINKLKIMNLDSNEIEEEYLFCFSDNWRLNTVYAVHEWGNVINKLIFWDGQLRRLERPFFSDLQRINLNEIIVFENDKLKYHSRRFIWVSHFMNRPRFREDYMIIDDYHLSYLVEFNEIGDVVDEVIFYFGEDEGWRGRARPFDEIQVDERGNWIIRRINYLTTARVIIYK